MMKHLIEGNLYNFQKCRKDLITSLLAVKETEDMYESLKILIKERLLPYGNYISSCPKEFRKYLDSGYYERYESIDYIDMCETIHDELYDEKTEEVLDRYHNFLIRYVFKYVKENRTIGFKMDW